LKNTVFSRFQITQKGKRKKTPTKTSKEIDPAVKTIFLNKYRRTGVALTGLQLLEAARQRKLPVPSLGEALRFIREDVAELAGFAGGRQKPKHYQTVGVSKPGVFFVDYGEFNKKWASNNDNCTGFLLAVENLTNRLFVEATRGKDTNQWLIAVAKFLEKTRNVKLVYSDRDSVAQSEKFRNRLEKRYGIRWRFLAKDNKSYLAESLIGFFKKKLGQGLRRTGQDKKRWVDLVQPICQTYNDQKVPGTRFRRGGIDDHNFDAFVGQLFGEKDPELSRYNSFKAGPFATESWNKAIFKFKPGDKVVVLKSAVWKREPGAERKNFFEKRSAKGAFTSAAYTVAGRQLRADRRFKYMVPVYSLKEVGERHLNYYEPQLRKVGGWTEKETDEKETERERK